MVCRIAVCEHCYIVDSALRGISSAASSFQVAEVGVWGRTMHRRGDEMKKHRHCLLQSLLLLRNNSDTVVCCLLPLPLQRHARSCLVSNRWCPLLTQPSGVQLEPSLRITTLLLVWSATKCHPQNCSYHAQGEVQDVLAEDRLPPSPRRRSDTRVFHRLSLVASSSMLGIHAYRHVQKLGWDI